MTSKERVLCAVNLSKPDRIPMDFAANEGVLKRLSKDLKASSYRNLLEKLNSDIVDIRGVVDPIYNGPIPKETYSEDGVKTNFWGIQTKTMQTATGPEECYVNFIFKDVVDIWEMEEHLWPKVEWFDFSGISKCLEDWKEFAIMASGASVFQHPTFLRSFDALLMDMMVNKEIANYLLDRFTDFYVRYFDRMFTYARGKIDILRIADDLGMQDRLLISKELFSEFIIPRVAKITDMAHSHGVKVMFHSCGSIIPFIPSLIEIGIDILDPIQIRAKGMEPESIKNSFGKQICLHGSIDTQYVLPKGSEKVVASEVKKMIDILGKDGGFILSPSHVLQTDVSTGNIVTLYQTGLKYGREVYSK